VGGRADIDALVRLRRLLCDARGFAAGPDLDGAVATVLEAGLGSGDLLVAVVDAPGGGLAACGVGMVAQRLPSPGNLGGRYGYVQSMVTDPAFRRRGLARAVLVALLDRFAAVGVTRVDLHATDQGAPLYRSLGFTDASTPELRWRAG
jgi:ribosomal protein S18 acetylase RimI-like enzyme